MMCPNCGSTRLRIFDYDDADSETGYHDWGEGFECLDCGAGGNVDELDDDDESEEDDEEEVW